MSRTSLDSIRSAAKHSPHLALRCEGEDGRESGRSGRGARQQSDGEGSGSKQEERGVARVERQRSNAGLQGCTQCPALYIDSAGWWIAGGTPEFCWSETKEEGQQRKQHAAGLRHQLLSTCLSHGPPRSCEPARRIPIITNHESVAVNVSVSREKAKADDIIVICIYSSQGHAIVPTAHQHNLRLVRTHSLALLSPTYHKRLGSTGCAALADSNVTVSSYSIAMRGKVRYAWSPAGIPSRPFCPPSRSTIVHTYDSVPRPLIILARLKQHSPSIDSTAHALES
ncbi:uncharacterized protein MYCFIDRAFT_169657 [Pseudocercospora fijiensis CIRAD86]|uniref:Uncharacterized protein n=1 Tax=Pseudocercospora fijiensis (strain CIRAD86) TaxID=383855 RepID=N1Q841_PSEFD|nr:uncharacterized protein MYCFIDRAFT_169657 [Pseudocercospora fijiensis CIRAD86]EME87931.1 hypothetical protein MYCFIDRAFT_169657 [Pseudocercospora fijiensis CIRAD86]